MLPSITSESEATDPANQLILPDKDLDEAIDRLVASLATPPSKEDVRKFLAMRPSLDENFRNDVRTVLRLSPQYLKLAQALTFLR